jgi:hypothetical protein
MTKGVGSGRAGGGEGLIEGNLGLQCLHISFTWEHEKYVNGIEKLWLFKEALSGLSLGFGSGRVPTFCQILNIRPDHC